MDAVELSPERAAEAVAGVDGCAGTVAIGACA